MCVSGASSSSANIIDRFHNRHFCFFTLSTIDPKKDGKKNNGNANHSPRRQVMAVDNAREQDSNYLHDSTFRLLLINHPAKY